MDEIERTIEDLARQVAAELGLEVVECRFGRARKRRHLRIDIDRAGPSGVGIDDCQRMSRSLERRIDERDVVPDSYVLEVSSPGVERPILTADDVRRNTGRRIVVETLEPIDGETRFRGVLAGGTEDAMRVEADGRGAVSIPLAAVKRARQDVPF